MRLSEIDKSTFHQRLIDPRPEKVENQIKLFRQRAKEYDWEVIMNHSPDYPDQYQMTAQSAQDFDDPTDHKQTVRTIYYELFVVNHFETENNLSIMHVDEDTDYMTWAIYLEED